MAIATATQRRTLVTAYTGAATHAALYQSFSGTTPGTEVTGGSYARQAITWGTVSTSGATDVVTGTVPSFSVPSGMTVAGAGVTAGTAGAFLDGAAVTSQTFASAGTYTLTLTYTQS